VVSSVLGGPVVPKITRWGKDQLAAFNWLGPHPVNDARCTASLGKRDRCSILMVI
jgi:hypothetical protein